MKLKIFLSALLLSMVISSAAAPPSEEGKLIFSTRCGNCHNVNKMVVGPALAGVDQRHSIDWIVKFVQSSQTMIKSGDKDAEALFTKFNKIPMPDHPDLTADHIKSVVEYIKTQASTAIDKAPFERPSKLRPAYVPVSLSNYGFFLGLLTGIALLIASLLLFVRVKEYERNKNREK